MNLELLAALPSLRKNETTTFKDDLTRLITQGMTDEPVTIRSARDRFSEINRRASQGHIQVVTNPAGQKTIIISLDDLAAMLHATVSGVSLSDALNISGFTPVRRKRLVLQEGLKRDKELVLHRKAEVIVQEEEQQKEPGVIVAAGGM